MANQKRILIIDDDERNIFALTAVLQSRNFECLTAMNGCDGLRIMKSTPDIFMTLVDMMMPGMDGYQLIGTIRTDPAISGFLLVAVTAQAMTGDREKCLAAGADGYIAKPVNIDALMEMMNKFCNDTPPMAS